MSRYLGHEILIEPLSTSHLAQDIGLKPQSMIGGKVGIAEVGLDAFVGPGPLCIGFLPIDFNRSGVDPKHMSEV